MTEVLRPEAVYSKSLIAYSAEGLSNLDVT